MFLLEVSIYRFEKRTKRSVDLRDESGRQQQKTNIPMMLCNTGRFRFVLSSWRQRTGGCVARSLRCRGNPMPLQMAGSLTARYVTSPVEKDLPTCGRTESGEQWGRGEDEQTHYGYSLILFSFHSHHTVHHTVVLITFLVVWFAATHVEPYHRT
jgi:hypothetical protein